METKSPTASVKSREIIGVDQFSRRREVFDKYDTVFMPSSPTLVSPVYKEMEPIITTNHGITTSNFKRNTPIHSSMRESRNNERVYDFRPRKYSDNFTSDLNQSDEVEYRNTMTERTRHLSILRKQFLNSNLHEPSADSPLSRTGTRSSMPTRSKSVNTYKIDSTNVYKFPFAEPFASPSLVRKIMVDQESIDGKENADPTIRSQHQSLTTEPRQLTKEEQQKLFEKLLKRYSPQRKPLDWKLPPTKPRIVGTISKSSSGTDQSIDGSILKNGDAIKNVDDNKEIEVLENNDANHIEQQSEIIPNGPPKPKRALDTKQNNITDSGASLSELAEKNDQVPELSKIKRQLSKEPMRQSSMEKDLTIPALIEKISAEGDNLENNKVALKKTKRRRSFLDKLLGRNKVK